MVNSHLAESLYNINLTVFDVSSSEGIFHERIYLVLSFPLLQSLKGKLNFHRNRVCFKLLEFGQCFFAFETRFGLCSVCDFLFLRHG